MLMELAAYASTVAASSVPCQSVSIGIYICCRARQREKTDRLLRIKSCVYYIYADERQRTVSCCARTFTSYHQVRRSRSPHPDLCVRRPRARARACDVAFLPRSSCPINRCAPHVAAILTHTSDRVLSSRLHAHPSPNFSQPPHARLIRAQNLEATRSNPQ